MMYGYPPFLLRFANVFLAQFRAALKSTIAHRQTFRVSFLINSSWLFFPLRLGWCEALIGTHPDRTLYHTSGSCAGQRWRHTGLIFPTATALVSFNLDSGSLLCALKRPASHLLIQFPAQPAFQHLGSELIIKSPPCVACG